MKGPHLFKNKKNLIQLWCMILYIAYIYNFLTRVYILCNESKHDILALVGRQARPIKLNYTTPN